MKGISDNKPEPQKERIVCFFTTHFYFRLKDVKYFCNVLDDLLILLKIILQNIMVLFMKFYLSV